MSSSPSSSISTSGAGEQHRSPKSRSHHRNKILLVKFKDQERQQRALEAQNAARLAEATPNSVFDAATTLAALGKGPRDASMAVAVGSQEPEASGSLNLASEKRALDRTVSQATSNSDRSPNGVSLRRSKSSGGKTDTKESSSKAKLSAKDIKAVETEDLVKKSKNANANEGTSSATPSDKNVPRSTNKKTSSSSKSTRSTDASSEKMASRTAKKSQAVPKKGTCSSGEATNKKAHPEAEINVNKAVGNELPKHLPVKPKERFIPAHKKKSCALTFPERLMAMLDYADEMKEKALKKGEDPEKVCLSWLPDGDGFLVRDPVACTREVVPLFFKQAKFASITRKLYRWGFHQVERLDASQVERDPLPPDAMIFANENFHRDDRSGVAKMRSNAGGQKRRHPDADASENEIARITGVASSSTTSGGNNGGNYESPGSSAKKTKYEESATTSEAGSSEVGSNGSPEDEEKPPASAPMTFQQRQQKVLHILTNACNGDLSKIDPKLLASILQDPSIVLGRQENGVNDVVPNPGASVPNVAMSFNQGMNASQGNTQQLLQQQPQKQQQQAQQQVPRQDSNGNIILPGNTVVTPAMMTNPGVRQMVASYINGNQAMQMQQQQQQPPQQQQEMINGASFNNGMIQLQGMQNNGMNPNAVFPQAVASMSFQPQPQQNGGMSLQQAMAIIAAATGSAHPNGALQNNSNGPNPHARSLQQGPAPVPQQGMNQLQANPMVNFTASLAPLVANLPPEQQNDRLINIFRGMADSLEQEQSGPNQDPKLLQAMLSFLHNN